jgi:hypothetical protein
VRRFLLHLLRRTAVFLPFAILVHGYAELRADHEVIAIVVMCVAFDVAGSLYPRNRQ